MGPVAPASHRARLPWRPAVALVLLLFCVQVASSCNILLCNADFVAATFDLGSGTGSVGGGVGGPGGAGAGPTREAVNAAYCGALRSYSTCARRTARSCRGDLTYHAAAQGAQDLLAQHHCPRAAPHAKPRPPPRDPAPVAEACVYEKGLLARGGGAPRYVHCGVFGDPHVRTFGDDFQTCAVPGAWPAIDNEYLYVQVTSAPVRGAAPGGPTAVTKVTVILKSRRQCSRQFLYQAELDDVPAAFADGSVAGRGGGGPLVSSSDPGRHAAILAAHIGTLLVVRQSGRSLGLSVRTPRAVAQAFAPQQDLQLCVWGCPPSQRRPPPRGAAEAAAAARCAAVLPVRDVYQRACVLDLLASGEPNASAAAAVAALADARGMLGGEARLHLLPPPTAPAPALRAAASARRLASGAVGLLGLLIVGGQAVL